MIGTPASSASARTSRMSSIPDKCGSWMSVMMRSGANARAASSAFFTPGFVPMRASVADLAGWQAAALSGVGLVLLSELLAGGLPDPRRPGLTVRTVAGGFLAQAGLQLGLDGVASYRPVLWAYAAAYSATLVVFYRPEDTPLSPAARQAAGPGPLP